MNRFLWIDAPRWCRCLPFHTMCNSPTPGELGYRFPAEWEEQEAVWFAWPVAENLWPGCLSRVREQMARLYALAARFQTVRVLCPQRLQPQMHAALEGAGGGDAVELFDYEPDDVWCRDFGPLFLVGGKGDSPCVTDWKFNAWGGKFPRHEKDNRVPAWIARQLGLRCFSFDTVLEGGAIESNGAGRVLATEATLLHPNRNGVVGKSEIETRLAEGLGVREVVWLKEGLVGDDTDGHVDNLARFFKTDGVLMAAANPADGANTGILEENERALRDFRTEEGRAFTCIELPLPAPVEVDGKQVAASYLNFLILNGGVLVPTYRQPECDARALEIIGGCFPGRRVLGFDCTDIVREGGALHCLSQPQPAG